MPPNLLNENDVHFQEGLPFSPPSAPPDATFRSLQVFPPRPQIDNAVEKKVALMEAQRELDAEHAARVKAEGVLKSLKLEMEENAKLRATLQESLQRVGRLPSSLLLVGRRALILGGGPAGLALAVSLSQRGCMVQVHERTTEEQTKSKGFGWLLMPNGVKALEALGVKKRCLREARAIESTETYVHHQEGGNKDEVEGIFSCTREDLVSGMIEVLPKGCVIRGSRVLDIETEGSAEQTTVTAVKVMAASGQESWLRLRQPNQENDFDYVFGADGVNSLLARRLNPEMSRRPGGSHNTIVTCLKDDRLAQQLGARFVKTYFHSVTKGQCCAFGLLSPAMGVVLGFMQFSTVLHGTAPYKSEKNMRADVRGFIIDVLGLPSVIRANESENIRMLRTYLGALSRDDFDHHIWRFVPTGFAAQSHGVNCALLGDALHPMSDFSSQGVSSALGDAVLLGKCLSAEAAADGMDTSISAFESYDSERRIVVSQLIAAGERIKGNFISGRGLLRRSFTRSGSFDSSTIDTASLGSPEEGFGTSLAQDAGMDDTNFLDPFLVNMPVLSMQAYNYRWATLPSGVIPLSAASSDFPVCPAIVSALKDHVTQGYFCYGPNEGLPRFRESFAAYFSDRLARGVFFCKEHKEEGSMRFGATTIEAGQVMATNAAAAAVYASAAATILQPGDEALVMSPVDFLLSKSVTSMGGVVTHYSVKARNGSTNPTFDLAEMQTLVTPRTRMLSICNPHNPLGRAWKLRELQDLVNFAELHRLSIVSDEVWSDLVHAPRVHIPTACVSPYAAAHTYSIFGFSKSHGLEGLRIGALVAPSVEQLTKALTLSHTDTTANGASVAAQVAAITAMTEAGSHNVGWLASWRLHLRACVRHAVMRLNKMEGVHAIEPEAGFVIWANISRLLYHNIQNSNNFSNDEEPEMELMQWLIREHKVCIIPGLDRFFGPGSKGHIRLSVATSKPVLDEALDRLERGLKVWLQQRQTLLKSLSPRSTNATENTGQKAEGIRNVCVVDKDASGGGQQSECMVVADSTRESDACRTVASSDKLTATMRDLVQDIKSIRGVLNEKVQG